MIILCMGRLGGFGGEETEEIERKVEAWVRSTIFGWGHGADLHGCVDYRVCSTTSISRLSHGIVEISSLHFGDMLEAQRLPRGHAVHEISFKSADPVIMVTPLVGRVLLAFFRPCD